MIDQLLIKRDNLLCEYRNKKLNIYHLIFKVKRGNLCFVELLDLREIITNQHLFY